MEKRRIKLLLTSLLVMVVMSLSAQSNTVTAGGDGSSPDGSFSYSVGQLDYVVAEGSGGSAWQGVQHPFEIIILEDNTFEEIAISATVHPNPTIGQITLTISDDQLDGLSYQLSDLSGRTLRKQRIEVSRTTMSLEDLSSSTYLLTVSRNDGVLKTFKIIKN